MIDGIKKEVIVIKFNLLFYKNERWDSRFTKTARNTVKWNSSFSIKMKDEILVSAIKKT
jgi:hypothetical protein